MEFGINTLLYINNKVLLYNTGNCIQYLVITPNGESEDVRITESLCCASETNTTLYINDIPIKLFKKEIKPAKDFKK